MGENIKNKPDWLKVSFKRAGHSEEVEKLLKDLGLSTVCDEAMCPNRSECFSKKRATFMILGSVCTRNCTFCNVSKGDPGHPDPDEPKNIAKAVEMMKMKHVVITSVTRDDLADGGSGHFAKVIGEIKKLDSDVIIEVLIPDFQGDYDALKKVVEAKPHIINHNLETVPVLYHEVRPMAIYERSLELLKRVKEMDPSIYTKSGIMLGLGEKKEQVLEVMKDLKAVDCDFLTIGQYLRPSKEHHDVVEYIHPEVFEEYRLIAVDMGFKYVASSPFVRSSYNAEEALSGENNTEK
ncbi:MAG: lipoyl synthase [Eubacteriaceae bacterium]|nr:lipoyl synthase [Eubacteriaceae bacterium]